MKKKESMSEIIDNKESLGTVYFLIIFHLQFFGQIRYNHLPNGILLKRWICRRGEIINCGCSLLYIFLINNYRLSLVDNLTTFN